MAYDSYYDTSGQYEPPRPQEEYANEQAYASPQSYNPPYPSQHVSDQIQMPQPRMPSPSFQNPPPNAGNPLYGHVNNDAAFAANNNVHPAHTNNPNYLSPELISQVTATVIQQLKAYGFPGQQQAPPPPPPPVAAPAPGPPAQEQPVPSPQPSTTPGIEATYYNPPAPYRDPQPQDTRGQEPVSVPLERRDIQTDKRSGTGPSPEPRANVVGRAHTEEELTTLEKIWGKLFDDGKPTPRLGQFLRGIAVHLIEDYPPGNTIVVVPEKMQKYYADTKVPTDTYPWRDIFDDRTSSISRIYRDIEAEHHLVQHPKDLRERPGIPGLTPRGFEKWYTLMIQANPDREYARLQRTVVDMPISNPDDKKERFPKDLPRRLLPSSPDLRLLEKLETSIITHCEVELPRNPPQERSKSPSRRVPMERSPSRVPPISERVSPAAAAAAASLSKSNSQDREATSAVVDEDEEEATPASRPIERERKPYSAQPGGGKVYEDAVPTSIPKSESTSAGRPAQTHSQDPPYSRVGGGPTSAGPPSHSAAHAHHGSISLSKPGSSNRRSSSVGINVNKAGDYRHSEPDLSSYEPSYVPLDSGDHYKLSSGASGDGFDDDRQLYRAYDRDDSRDYELIRERERERERRHLDHLGGSGRSSWIDEDYYRGGGLLGGQGGGAEYKYR